MIGRCTLATGLAKGEYRIGTQLLLHTSLSPRDRDGVIVEQDGAEALLIWPLRSPEWATPYAADAGTAPVLLDPDKVRVVRVVVSDTTLRRRADVKP